MGMRFDIMGQHGGGGGRGGGRGGGGGGGFRRGGGGFHGGGARGVFRTAVVSPGWGWPGYGYQGYGYPGYYPGYAYPQAYAAAAATRVIDAAEDARLRQLYATWQQAAQAGADPQIVAQARAAFEAALFASG